MNSTRVKFAAFFLCLVLVGGGAFAGGVAYGQQTPALQLAAPARSGVTPAPQGGAPATPQGGATAGTLGQGTATLSVPAGSEQSFSLLVQAWNTIVKNYVDQPAANQAQLTYGAISGMVDALGDTGHSRFLSPQMVQQEQSSINGQFEGIGAQVQFKDNHVVIVAPMDGSPALKAGVLPGDVVLKVNDADVTGQSLEKVVGQILGPAGTQVSLTLQNSTTRQTRTLTITRARITINSVSWSMAPGATIADVRISAFSQGVTAKLKDALTAAKAQGATALVLDLRNNPGGLLDEAIGVASQFLAGGSVLQEKDASGKITTTAVRPGGVATGLPLVVLVNNGTASAAEIVAGAIQDAGRGRILGETTFGTGTVLNIFTLSDQSALLLATQEWLTPKGSSIWHKGITPDLPVTLDVTIMPLAPEALKTMDAAQLQSSPDVQFLAALNALK